jgi:hypothetical protein
MSNMQSPLKAAIKRGALIAAANWQVSVIQASADSLFKLLLAAPIIGGVFLLALAIGSEPASIVTLGWRQMVATITSSVVERPIVLAAVLLSTAVVAVGGSLFVFLVKAGTVSTLVRSERDAGPIEDAPLHVGAVAQLSRFTADDYVESARALFPRYARLGFMLMAVYLLSGTGFLLLVVRRDPQDGWSLTALLSACFVAWITIVNLVYLLMQIVVAADGCSVAMASRRVAAFLRREPRHVGAVLLLVLALIVAATGASILATAALGLVAFVPFFGLAALPLQLLAWLLRGLLFQYIGLTSVGAYLRLYRAFADRELGARGHQSSSVYSQVQSQA